METKMAKVGLLLVYIGHFKPDFIEDIVVIDDGVAFERRRVKTNALHMRKQRRRSASR